MFKKICLFLISTIFLAGCNSPLIQEMYHGKQKDESREKLSNSFQSKKYSSEKNVDRMSDTEINSSERAYLKAQHRSMDSTRDARRAKVFGGWSPVKKRD
jgi:uncharacterized protein YxeA